MIRVNGTTCLINVRTSCNALLTATVSGRRASPIAEPPASETADHLQTNHPALHPAGMAVPGTGAQFWRILGSGRMAGPSCAVLLIWGPIGGTLPPMCRPTRRAKERVCPLRSWCRAKNRDSTPDPWNRPAPTSLTCPPHSRNRCNLGHNRPGFPLALTIHNTLYPHYTLHPQVHQVCRRLHAVRHPSAESVFHDGSM